MVRIVHFILFLCLTHTITFCCLWPIFRMRTRWQPLLSYVITWLLLSPWLVKRVWTKKRLSAHDFCLWAKDFCLQYLACQVIFFVSTYPNTDKLFRKQQKSLFLVTRTWATFVASNICPCGSGFKINILLQYNTCWWRYTFYFPFSIYWSVLSQVGEKFALWRKFLCVGCR